MKIRRALFLLSVLAAVALVPLFGVGCASDAVVYNGDFQVTEINTYTSLNQQSVSYSFSCDVREAGRYEISLVLIGKKGSVKAWTHTATRIVNLKKGEEQTVVGYVDVDTDVFATTVEFDGIANVRRLQSEDESGYNSIAIGYGVTVGVLFCAVTGFFLGQIVVSRKKRY